MMFWHILRDYHSYRTLFERCFNVTLSRKEIKYIFNPKVDSVCTNNKLLVDTLRWIYNTNDTTDRHDISSELSSAVDEVLALLLINGESHLADKHSAT